MKAKTFVTGLLAGLAVVGMTACGGPAAEPKGVHELSTSFVGDGGDTPVSLVLNDQNGGKAEVTDTFMNPGSKIDLGTVTWSHGEELCDITGVTVDGVDLTVNTTAKTITMLIGLTQKGISVVESGETFVATFSYAKCTYEIAANPEVTDAKVYDFVLGNFATLATPVTEVTLGNWIAVHATTAEGKAVLGVTIEGEEAQNFNGYWCVKATKAKKHAIVITTGAPVAE